MEPTPQSGSTNTRHMEDVADEQDTNAIMASLPRPMSNAEEAADREFKVACRIMGEKRKLRDALRKKREDRELRKNYSAAVSECAKLKHQLQQAYDAHEAAEVKVDQLKFEACDLAAHIDSLKQEIGARDVTIADLKRKLGDLKRRLGVITDTIEAEGLARVDQNLESLEDLNIVVEEGSLALPVCSEVMP